MKTYSPKASEIQRDWYVVDATDMVLGRLATQIAVLLRGKHKPTFAPHMDSGDFVVVTNCEKIVVTGRKAEQKVYRRHSGYPGGLKTVRYKDMLARHPERILRFAVKGMLPKGRLGRQQIKKLKIYAGTRHPHTAQQPNYEQGKELLYDRKAILPRHRASQDSGCACPPVPSCWRGAHGDQRQKPRGVFRAA
jgi:large subunit ribosomal protein L13